MKILLAVLVLWIITGILSYGVAFNWSQSKWPALAYASRKFDRSMSLFIGVTGPVGLIVGVITALRDGCLALRYRALPAEESWAAHKRLYPTLSKEWWEGKG